MTLQLARPHCRPSAQKQPATNKAHIFFSLSSTTQPQLKMNAAIISGVCLLFLFTLSTADLCSDFGDPTSDLFQCNAELVQRSSSACEDDCRTSLEQYADDCLTGVTAQTFKNGIDVLCSSSTPTGSGSDTAGGAGGMGPTIFSTASALFFAVYAAFF